MAHLVDGVLSLPVLACGTVAAAAGIAWGLKRIESDRLPHVGILTAAFFVASLIHVPVGPSSVHLLLNGLVGIVLGWAAVPAIFVGLVLQAAFFGYGGLTVLGINTLAIAGPAIVAHAVFFRGRGLGSPFAWGCVAGALAVAGTSLMIALSLALSGEAFLIAAKLVIVAHVPVMAAEAFMTGTVVAFLHRVKPDALTALPSVPAVGTTRALG